MSNSNNLLTPPKWLLRLLRHLLKPHYLEEIEGDMEERFQDNLERYNVKQARRLYVLDSLKLLRPSLMKNLGGGYRLNYYDMFQHQLKIVWRQTAKQKVFSTIKIGGFAIGIAACILIALFVGHQLSHDQHYLQKDQIFRVVNKWTDGGESEYWTNVHGPLKPLLEDNIPEIEKLARVVLWSWGDAGENHIRSVESSYNYFEEGFIYADPELLNILEIPMVNGSQKEALLAPNRIVISRSKAEKYFPGQNPVGQSIILNENPETTYTIGGVMEDFPTTSHLQADFILTLYERKNGPGTSDWCCTNYALYTRITPFADKTEVEEKIVSLRNSHVIDKLKEAGKTALKEMQEHQSYYLQPVGNIYLNPEKVGDDLAHGSIEMAWIFGFIAITILLMACVNFVNLSIAKSLKRAKEVGLKKVLGSFRSSLIYQYLVESCLYTLIAILLGGLFAWLAMPSFNQLAYTSLTIPWLSAWFIPLLLALSFIIGILSGIYPAFYLSRFQPIDALKNFHKRNGKTSIARNALIVFQFSATIILIIAALVTHKQFQFLMDKSLGYEKEHVVNIAGLETMDENKKEAFKQELQRFAKMYDELNRAKTVFIFFSVLSIVIACSGLFALSLYLIGQRSKEISIRKVLGASVSKIFWLLSFDFVKLVIIAIMIAVPVAWYFMDYLLADKANRIELSWYIFAWAGMAVVMITLGTVSFEAIKAALTNPAEQLRND